MVDGSLQCRSSSTSMTGVVVDNASKASVISRSIRSFVAPNTSSRRPARSRIEIRPGMCNSHVGAWFRSTVTSRGPSDRFKWSNASKTGRYGSPSPNCWRQRPRPTAASWGGFARHYFAHKDIDQSRFSEPRFPRYEDNLASSGPDAFETASEGSELGLTSHHRKTPIGAIDG